MGVVFRPPSKSKHNVFVLDHFAEPDIHIVWNQENGKRFIIGDAFIQKAFAESAIGFAEDEHPGQNFGF
jgi:hypothetical protein